MQERASLTRTPANAKRIADLDTRIQVMQQRMQMHDMQAQNPNPGMSGRRTRSGSAKQSGGNEAQVHGS